MTKSDTKSYHVEIWLGVLDWEEYYMVSSLGRVKRLPKQIIRRNGIVQTWGERLLNPSHDKDGYRCCNLAHCGTVVPKKVHRLVVEAFIGKIPKGMEVNHKNGIKDDNRLINLEIATPSENILHRYHTLGLGNNATEKLGKPIDMYAILPRRSQKQKPSKGEFIMTFRSIGEAARHLGMTPSHIAAAAKTKRTAGGYMWEFSQDLN